MTDNVGSSNAQPAPARTGKRLWSLLRIVTHTSNVMRRSLKKEEQEFLDIIVDEFGEILPQDYHCDNRKDLAYLIDSNEDAFEAVEVEFLRKLLSSRAVTSATVATVRDSVKSSIRSSLRSTIRESLLEPLPEREEKISVRRNDAAFRKELWKISQQDYGKSNQSAKETQQEKDPEQQQGKQDDPSLLDYLFESFFKIEEKKEEDETKADSTSDVFSYHILGTSEEDVDCSPHVLTPPIMKQIRRHLPSVVAHDNFWLRFSMQRDGASVRSLISKVRNASRTVLAIETMDGDVLGAFVSSPWMPQGAKFYGSGEAFLWRMQKSRHTPCQTVQEQIELESDIQFFKWSGTNRNVQRLERPDSQLILGGGGSEEQQNESVQPPAEGIDDTTKDYGSALVLLPNLEKGYSLPCLTFKSPALPPSSTDAWFEIANIEVWSLTPMDNIGQAEKVELGRRFIFDHSDFVEW